MLAQKVDSFEAAVRLRQDSLVLRLSRHGFRYVQFAIDANIIMIDLQGALPFVLAIDRGRLPGAFMLRLGEVEGEIESVGIDRGQVVWLDLRAFYITIAVSTTRQLVFCLLKVTRGLRNQNKRLHHIKCTPPALVHLVEALNDWLILLHAHL